MKSSNRSPDMAKASIASVKVLENEIFRAAAVFRIHKGSVTVSLTGASKCFFAYSFTSTEINWIQAETACHSSSSNS